MLCLEPFFTPSTGDAERYKHLRELSRGLNQKIVKTIPRRTLFEVGKAIGIAIQGNSFFFECEDETSVLMDCCLYDWIEKGKSLVEKYAETNLNPSPAEAELLHAYLQAKYRILISRSRVEGAGAEFVDLFSAEKIFIMDIAMSRTPLGMAYATRTIPLGQFWMTGGAALPADSDGIHKAILDLARHRSSSSGEFIDPHTMALTFVRTLLDAGSMERIAYESIKRKKRTHSRLTGKARTNHRRLYPPGGINA